MEGFKEEKDMIRFTLKKLSPALDVESGISVGQFGGYWWWQNGGSGRGREGAEGTELRAPRR